LARKEPNAKPTDKKRWAQDSLVGNGERKKFSGSETISKMKKKITHRPRPAFGGKNKPGDHQKKETTANMGLQKKRKKGTTVGTRRKSTNEGGPLVKKKAGEVKQSRVRKSQT